MDGYNLTCRYGLKSWKKAKQLTISGEFTSRDDGFGKLTARLISHSNIIQ